ncbi:MAG TPA: hypothetical protein VFB53_06970 [Burkholderiales bacterium]|nr:hypothetical protein [Burkholderiales bacterium]
MPAAQPSVFASVAFLKIHDFGRRPVVEQTRLRAQLEAAVAVTLHALAEPSRVVLDAADGVALVVFGDPRGALRIAERALSAGAAGLPLAIGITHGAVRQTGEGAGEGLLGDGIAVAAAIAELAGPQKLLLTREFRAALADAAPGAEAAVAGAGTHTDASLRSHELYRPDAFAARRRARRYAAATVLAALCLVGSGAGYRASIEGPRAYAGRVAADLKGAAAKAQERALRLLQQTGR